MMIETRVIQEHRLCCDRCGKPAKVISGRDDWPPSGWTSAPLPDLYAEALRDCDFHVSRWVQDGCPRELWLCGGCWDKAVKKAAGGVVWESEGIDNAIIGVEDKGG